MRTLQRAGAALTVLIVAGGLTACGDDDKSAAKFCDAVLEFNSTVFEIDISEDTPKDEIIEAGDKLVPAFKTVVDEAPDSVAADAKELNKSITPLADGDAEAFNDDATFEAYNEFIEGAVPECDFPTVEVTAEDYAFDAPDTVKAGDVAFSFTNASEGEEHEMIIMRKAAGVALSWEEIFDLPEEESMTKATFAGFAFAPPGGSSSNLASLDAGDYAMVCFIPVGGEEDGPPHFTQGMLHEFTVE